MQRGIDRTGPRFAPQTISSAARSRPGAMVTCCDELLFRLGRNDRGSAAQAAGLPQKWLIASAVSAREHRLAEGVQIDDGRDADDETAHAAEQVENQRRVDGVLGDAI